MRFTISQRIGEVKVFILALNGLNDRNALAINPGGEGALPGCLAFSAPDL